MSKIDTTDSTPTAESQAASNSYCPSVPISVYRELVGELRQTQAQLDILKSQNQQLRQEVEKVLHSTGTLKQVVESFERPTDYLQASHLISADVPEEPISRVNPATEEPMTTVSVSQLTTEIKPTLEASSYPPGQTSLGLNRWTLALIFGAIGLSAFLLGFFVVPTLVKPPNR